MSTVSYLRDFLPDLLWIVALLDAGLGPDGLYEPLDVIEELAPPQEVQRGERKELELVDGRLSSFAYVPDDLRATVRTGLRKRTPWALPDNLGHALSLYPDGPAFWLYEDWRETNTVDPEAGLRYLKRLMLTYGDRSTPESTVPRMIPIARMLKAGRLHVPREIGQEWVKYPTHLDEEGQRMVEAGMRAQYNLWGSAEFAPPLAYPWAQSFWRQNWKLSPCEVSTEPPPAGALEEEEGETPFEEADRGIPTADPRTSIETVHAGWMRALQELGDDLRQRQGRAEMDLWDPTADEIRFGLASRQFRLLYELIDDPNLWSATGAAHLLRAVVETRIVSAWLLQKNDVALYERFREYGLGKHKLYKLHVEDYIEQHGDSSDLDELREWLDREVNSEILEEFQKIDLGGNFAGVSVRDMADQAELKPLYTLNYQPLSAEAHGEWSSLRASDLDVCVNPLHRFHRIGRFAPPDGGPSMALVRALFVFVSDTIGEIYAHYGLTVDDAFDTATAAMEAAVATAST